MAEPRQKGRGGATGKANVGQAAPPTRISLWIIGAGLIAVAVIILLVFALTQQKIDNRSGSTASGGSIGNSSPAPTDGKKPTAVIISDHVPELVSPADNASVDRLDSQVTFTWQRVIDAPATYNIEFQYSDDGSNWSRSEIVYGLNDILYVRTNPFLSYRYVRWQVWATISSGDSDKSDWRQLTLPVQQ